MLSQISEAHVEMNYMLLRGTFLNDDNAHLFELPNPIITWFIKTELLNLKVVLQYIFVTIFSIFSEKTEAIL